MQVISWVIVADQQDALKFAAVEESCYNMQAAVDSKNHLIVNYLVTNEASDLNQLSSVAISAKETLGVSRLIVYLTRVILILCKSSCVSIVGLLLMLR